MVLQATDELRHEWDDDYFWRESLYFNFADPINELGGWIYLWVVPNQSKRSGMLVSFYHGITDRLDTNDRAMVSADHVLRSDNGAWVYCYKRNVSELLEADFDNASLCGLRLERRHPLESYRLTFEDDYGSGFDLDCRFLTAPWDYADGVVPTLPFVANNRYHRTWTATGQVRIAGESYEIQTHGDSDHSWGTRDPLRFGETNFKMWSFQSGDGVTSASVIEQGLPGAEQSFGFLALEDRIAAVSKIRSSASYSSSGVQEAVGLLVEDIQGRSAVATMPKMFAGLGFAGDGLWGFEGVGVYEVEGVGPCSGVVSYFWPPTTSPAMLSNKM